jgi:outer membrane protein assembly factor BamB
MTMAGPSVYPAGITVHDGTKAYQGLTLFNVMAEKKVYLIDMQGAVVNTWAHPEGGRFGPLAKPLPNGKIMALFGTHKDRGVGIFNWDGELIREFFKQDWNLNHDFQFGSTYFGPDMLPHKNMLVLAKTLASFPTIASYPIYDEIVSEIAADGTILRSWSTSEHFDQLRIPEKGKQQIYQGTARYGDRSDIYHTNSVNLLPGNRHGKTDARFAKGNYLISQRHTNKVFIVDHENGDIVWWLDDCLLGNNGTVGQHHVSMIPNWLPGAGNILIYDNGGQAGYPEDNRFFSRVIELDPVTCDVVWEYNASNAGMRQAAFFSRTRGSAQRLPNGNTLITEPVWLRIFEVTSELEIVWEYVHPQSDDVMAKPGAAHIYRAYRVSENWQNDLDAPTYPEPTGRRWFAW